MAETIRRRLQLRYYRLLAGGVAGVALFAIAWAAFSEDGPNGRLPTPLGWILVALACALCVCFAIGPIVLITCPRCSESLGGLATRTFGLIARLGARSCPRCRVSLDEAWPGYRFPASPRTDPPP